MFSIYINSMYLNSTTLLNLLEIGSFNPTFASNQILTYMKGSQGYQVWNLDLKDATFANLTFQITGSRKATFNPNSLFITIPQNDFNSLVSTLEKVLGSKINC